MKIKGLIRIGTFISILIVIALLGSACVTIASAPPSQGVPTAINAGSNAPQSTTQPAAPVIVVASTSTLNPNAPGEPPSAEGSVTDTDSSKFASEKRVVSGDSYLSNFYERPFTAQTMIYLPDVDIINGYISSDTNYYYFTIELHGVNTQTGAMVASYGVELDTDKDGRGDYSVWALNPTSTTWVTNNVTVRQDRNGDVGGKDAYGADTSLSVGDGYETILPNDGAQQSWARINPNSPNIVQIAVNRSQIGSPLEFLWGVWADNGPRNPGLFDYNDHFTYEQAGSPIIANQYYPLKKVAAIDNTCRRPYGFAPGYRIANMCWSAPAPAPTGVAGPTQVPSCYPLTCPPRYSWCPPC